MKRAIALWLTVSAMGWLTPSAFGQYPYPYAPPTYGPMPYAPPYYGPAPMPGYAPGYGPPPMMMPQPMPYQPRMMMAPPPQPQWQPPPANIPRVLVYGPLPAAPMETRPMKTLPEPDRGFPEPANPSAAILPAQANPTTTLPPETRGVPEACDDCGSGSMCFPDCIGPVCSPRRKDAPKRGHGHFFFDIGMNVVVPYIGNRQAFTTTMGGNTTTTEFPQAVDFSPRMSAGYLFHCGWGFRANYSYLRDLVNSGVANADLNTTISTPGAGLITSPSFALANGIGVDQFNFRQRLEIQAGDMEILKEWHCCDTTFLCGFGVRYAQIQQNYYATRTNTGGTSGPITVGADREDLATGSRFNGWGPVLSCELVHPLGHNFSLYGSARGAFLWGVDLFDQNYSNQSVVVIGGVPTVTNIATNTQTTDRHVVSVGEGELGLQYGKRCGWCYIYGRVGAVFHRWWDVGSPTATQGSLSLLGGAAHFGITY